VAASAIIGPLYCDASALAKVYLREPDSKEVHTLVAGRRDVIVSELAITEVVSSVARRRREGTISAATAAQIRATILADLEVGSFLRSDLTAETHREAEKLLLASSAALRTLDALHLAAALLARAASIVAYDRRLREGAASLGLALYPPSL
jgi:predicted nucleic acid-binding protein